MTSVGWRQRLLRLGLLFGLSVLLVAGFWFHAEFYQLGLAPLLLIGGLVVTGVILGFRLALSKAPFAWRLPRWEITARDADLLRARPQVQVLVPAPDRFPAAGTWFRAASDGKDLGPLAVRRVYRRLRDDLTPDEATALGLTPTEGAAKGPGDLITVAQLERLEG